MNIHEMRENVAYVAAVLRDIDSAAEGAPLDADTQVRFDEGLAFVDETRATIEAIEAREARSEELRSLAESGKVKMEAPNFQRSTTRDVFDLSTVDRSTEERYANELRDRAFEVAEKHAPAWVTDEQRESAHNQAAKESTRNYDATIVREHQIVTGSEQYLRDFSEWSRNPSMTPSGLIGRYHSSRAAMSLTAANGGVLVPQWLDPTIILTNAGSMNDVRSISRVEQVTVDQADFVTSAGVTAEWLAEATEAADATPTFVGPTITNHKRAAYMYGSYEMLADSGFDSVAPLVADAFSRQEATAFATGTGSAQPFGLITRLSGTGPVVTGQSYVTGITSTGDLVVGDIYELDNQLGDRWREKARFLANKAIYNEVRQLNSNSAGSTFWVDLGGGNPAELIGYPCHKLSGMDSTIVSGSDDYVLLLGDFEQYIITDRVGTTVMYNPLVLGSNRIPTGQAGWFAFGRVGADVVTSNAFKLLKL